MASYKKLNPLKDVKKFDQKDWISKNIVNAKLKLKQDKALLRKKKKGGVAN